MQCKAPTGTTTAGELPMADLALPDASSRLARSAALRAAAEQGCRAALSGRPGLLTRFEQLLQVNQRSAIIREEQARDFTLAWPGSCRRGVTDGGTLAAHASLVAREYAIPAVVGTGDATHRLHPGQQVTVDGGAGTVTPHDEPVTERR
jgi:phosphohistidine swiveling domain-containing protein